MYPALGTQIHAPGCTVSVDVKLLGEVHNSHLGVWMVPLLRVYVVRAPERMWRSRLMAFAVHLSDGAGRSSERIYLVDDTLVIEVQVMLWNDTLDTEAVAFDVRGQIFAVLKSSLQVRY